MIDELYLWVSALVFQKCHFLIEEVFSEEVTLIESFSSLNKSATGMFLVHSQYKVYIFLMAS